MTERLHATYTAAYAPKHGRAPVVPQQPVLMRDTVPQRCDSPSRSARERDFTGTGAKEALFGGWAGEPPQSISRGGPQVAASKREGSPATDRGRATTPAREAASAACSGIRRSGRMNESTNHIFPKEGEEDKIRGLWLAKPLANGRRLTYTKKMVEPPATAISAQQRADSPKPGKRVIQAEDHLLGVACTATQYEERPVHHRVARFHDGPSPFLVGHDIESKSRAELAADERKAGLLGLGPTGKRRIEERGGLGMGIIAHRDDGWEQPHARKTGVAKVAGRSDTHVDVTNLAQYTAAELNEKKFRPSSVHLTGPPPFVPPPPPERRNSPRRRVLEPPASGVLPLGTAPRAAYDNAPSFVLHRHPGTFSPLRQNPPRGASPQPSRSTPFRPASPWR